MSDKLQWRLSPALDAPSLNSLFASAWPGHEDRDFSYLSKDRLGYLCGFWNGSLIAFVHIVSDGNRHAFLLDTTVHKESQGKGVGRALVLEALSLARKAGIEWVHVDYEPPLEPFYRSCGFKPTKAGLVNLFIGALG